MNRIAVTFGASVLALGTMIAGVEGKTAFYEINGQRYSYDTNDRRQIAAARKLIDAANAADAAKTKAEAERTSNPLAALFGSQIQREAAEAKVRLEQLIAEQAQASAADKSRQGQQARNDKQNADLAEQKPEEATRANQNEQADASAPASPPAPSNPREQPTSDNASKAAVKSVTLDAETGIKTIIRADGSISEEPFDQSILSKLELDRSSANSTTRVVDQSVKASPVDTTGSTTLKGAQSSPSANASSQRGPRAD